MRTGWQKSDVVFSFACAPVGGHNAFKAVLEGNKKILENYGHIHAMANSFDLYAYGNYLAIPPSYGLTGSNFQNTLTIEGAIQQRSPIYEADLLKADLREDYAYVVGDATQCYPASIGLERWYRHVAFLPPDIFVIGDELSAAGTSTMNRITRWHIDYNPLFASTIDSVNQIIRITDKSALQANILYPAKPTYENIKVSPAVKQVNVMIKDIFSSDKERQILVVLSALENTATGAPASRLIRGENTIGAVVDSRNASRAAIFCINNKDGKDSFNRNFDFTSRSHTTCYLFSFLPDTGYDVSVSSKPGKDGMILYHMRVQKGKKYKTNSEGTMIVKTDDLR